MKADITTGAYTDMWFFLPTIHWTWSSPSSGELGIAFMKWHITVDIDF